MFRISALPLESFQHLLTMTDADLRAVGGRRQVADRRPGFPCRVSLLDAHPGETVILVPYVHQPADSPYRASGPIFVRENAETAMLEPGQVPALLRLRTLSLRAYDAGSMMIDARVMDGMQLEAGISTLFANASVEYLHVHYANAGCYACRVDRAASC